MLTRKTVVKAQGGGFRVFTVLQVNPAGAGLSQLALESLYIANAYGRLSMRTWCAVVCFHHKLAHSLVPSVRY